MVRVDIRGDSVAEIENMAFTLPKAAQSIPGFSVDYLFAGE